MHIRQSFQAETGRSGGDVDVRKGEDNQTDAYREAMSIRVWEQERESHPSNISPTDLPRGRCRCVEQENRSQSDRHAREDVQSMFVKQQERNRLLLLSQVKSDG